METRSAIERIERKRAETTDLYAERGFGGKYGFGKRAAIIVIDMANAWTNPEHPIGSNQDVEIQEILRLLNHARGLDIRRYFFTTGYSADLHDAGNWIRKVPVVGKVQLGTSDVEIDPRLEVRHDEPVVLKRSSSCFFGTPLHAWLWSEGVDTVVLVGNSTSGCVRLTCADAAAHGFRVIVPNECVSDRTAEVHEANLFDINAKYADVLPLDVVIAELEKGATERGKAES